MRISIQVSLIIIGSDFQHAYLRDSVVYHYHTDLSVLTGFLSFSAIPSLSLLRLAHNVVMPIKTIPDRQNQGQNSSQGPFRRLGRYQDQRRFRSSERNVPAIHVSQIHFFIVKKKELNVF
jgi:hypothetical protein